MSSQISLIPQTEPGKLLKGEVDQRLQQLLDEKVRNAPTPSLSRLWQHIAAATQGGKRMRPVLLNLGYRAVSDASDPKVVELGTAYELLHTALVLHDDIIDQDFVRRAQPTLAAHYRDAAAAQGQCQADAEHTGHSAALLAGDLLISQALQLLHTTANTMQSGSEVIEDFHRAILQSAAGELDDVLFSAHIEAPDLDDVLRMHRLKTAAYSFETPLRAGALLAGAKPEMIDDLGHLGRLLGSCYQIIDDVLGTFGDSTATGKPSDSDLREGKYTVLIALAESIPEARSTVQAWRAGDAADEEMRKVLVAHGIEAHARTLAEKRCVEAKEQLAQLPIRDEVGDTFRELIDDLLERKR